MNERTDIQKLVSEITDFVNSYTVEENAFIEAMSHEHHTLQQSFTRLVLRWLEYVASDEYRHDGRNEASHKIASELINTFKQFHENMRNNPSDYLPFI